MRQLAARHAEFERLGVAIVRVFHSPVDSLEHYVRGPSAAPFAVLADPARDVYRAYGVGSGWLGLFAPSAWSRALEARRAGLAARWTHAFAHGIRGYPADFAIDERGAIEHARYGRHFADATPIDELLAWFAPRDRAG